MRRHTIGPLTYSQVNPLEFRVTVREQKMNQPRHERDTKPHCARRSQEATDSQNALIVTKSMPMEPSYTQRSKLASDNNNTSGS
jgi:hypothetical protein